MKHSEIKMRFGKHKGKMAKDVPLSYIEWCVLNNVVNGKLLRYFKSQIKYPLNNYTVTVENSVNEMDGKHYNIMAWDNDHAINIMRRKVKATQSYHGTSIGAELVKDNSSDYKKIKNDRDLDNYWAIQNGYI